MEQVYKLLKRNIFTAEVTHIATYSIKAVAENQKQLLDAQDAFSVYWIEPMYVDTKDRPGVEL